MKRRKHVAISHTPRQVFEKLDREGWSILEGAKSYILLWDAHLPDKARNLIDIRIAGLYIFSEMQQDRKRLERPIPGTGCQRITGLTAFVEEQPSASDIQREG